MPRARPLAEIPTTVGRRRAARLRAASRTRRATRTFVLDVLADGAPNLSAE